MARFGAGDYVVHPGQGVCQIGGLTQRTTIAGATADEPGRQVLTVLYEMSPVADRRVSISYPVAKEDALRPIIGTEQARALIDEAPGLPVDPFDRPQAWTVREHFTEALRTGDCRAVMCVVKTMYERMAEALEQGKKPKSCYARIFEEARKRLFDELSIALDMTAGDAEALVCSRFGVEPVAPSSVGGSPQARPRPPAPAGRLAGAATSCAGTSRRP